MLLAKAERGDAARTPYADICKPLKRHLRDFGPKRRAYHPEFPFWHLQTDGFWKLEDPESVPKKKSGRSISSKSLLESGAVGRVPETLWRAVSGDRALVWELSEVLLHEFWPETLHASIRSAVGLSVDPPEVTTAAGHKRDPRFRDEVLRAYERKCAVCGYDGRLSDVLIGLDAAHIRWHAYGGPDIPANGLALCSFHHVAFDRGALGITIDGVVQISADVSGGEMADYLLKRFSGRRLSPPHVPDALPSVEFVTWHETEVFRAPPSLRVNELQRVAEDPPDYHP